MTALATRVSYGRLSAAAKDTIRWHHEGATIAGYVRHYFPDGIWRGDPCGCPDDRCIGFHHDEGDDCDLEAWLDQYWLEKVAPVVSFVDVDCEPGTCRLEYHFGTVTRRELGPFTASTAEQVRARWDGWDGHAATVREVRR